MRWFLRKSKLKHEPPDWALITEIALKYHTLPWIVEQTITLEWWERERVWKEESAREDE